MTQATRARRSLLRAGIALLASACMLPATHAADWPAQPIRLVVPFSPGGGSDTVARLLAQHLSPRLGQSIVVENRAGAGGSIGATQASRAAADGYTLLLGSSSEMVLYPAMYPEAQYDAMRDFTPISSVATVPLVLASTGALGAGSVQALLDKARAEPGKLNYGSAGVGSSTHMAVALLLSMTGTDMTHVPYKGSAPVVTDLLAGNLQLAMPTLSAVLPHKSDKRLSLLAISTATRSALLPDLPTMKEAGVRDYDVGLWTGLFAPAGMDPGIVERLNTEVQAVLAMPDVAKALASQGAQAGGSSAADFSARVAREAGVWKTLVRQAGLKAD